MAAAWTAWPGLLGGCILLTQTGFALGQPIAAFYLIYLLLAPAVLLLERSIPHERAWTKNDGQFFADVAHTLVSNGAIQGLLVFSGTVGLSASVTMMGNPAFAVWPHHWPLAAQVVFGLIVSEFALCWAHRLAHEWPPLWHFHAIHHSVEKLWIANSGRFHFVDAVKSVLPGILILVIMGAPMEVLTWLSAIGAYLGTLTHCNVAMRFGVLSLVFNTPELHRWHHSRVLREGNANYGENIMLWDWNFRTWFNESRRPPADIGVSEPVPDQFHSQILWPLQKLLTARPSPVAEAVDQT